MYVLVLLLVVAFAAWKLFLVSVLYWRWPPQKGHHYYHHRHITTTHIAHVAFVSSVEVLCAYIPTQLTFYISALSYILLWGIIIILSIYATLVLDSSQNERNKHHHKQQ